jgi:hypothetical protein
VRPEPRFVFLACSERSGSNLISSILGAHPRIKSPPPYHFARDVILNLHATGPGAADPARKVLNDQMLHMARTLGDEDQAGRLGAWLDAHPDATGAELARYVYAGLVDKPGADTVVVKENNLHRAAFFVLACFPEAKFVFQVRDPRDYLASAKARKQRVAGNKFGSLRNALTVWREDQLGGLALLGLLGPQRVFFQRYEDLVSHPRAVLEPLCEFLGVPFNAAMLDFHAGEDAARLSGTSGARENLSRPLMAGNFGKYRKTLSGGEIRTVETWLGELMDRFGYARDFPARSRPRGGDVFWPQLTEPFERLLNGERLPFYASGTKRLQARLRAAAGPVARPYVVEG